MFQSQETHCAPSRRRHQPHADCLYAARAPCNLSLTIVHYEHGIVHCEHGIQLLLQYITTLGMVQDTTILCIGRRALGPWRVTFGKFRWQVQVQELPNVWAHKIHGYLSRGCAIRFAESYLSSRVQLQVQLHVAHKVNVSQNGVLALPIWSSLAQQFCPICYSHDLVWEHSSTLFFSMLEANDVPLFLSTIRRANFQGK